MSIPENYGYLVNIRSLNPKCLNHEKCFLGFKCEVDVIENSEHNPVPFRRDYRYIAN